MTNQLNEITSTAAALFNQMASWPSSVLLGIILIIAGGALKAVGLVPCKLIPVCILVLGGALNYFIGDVAQVAPTQRHPDVILVMWGVCIGFAAWAAHRILLKRFEKYIPFLSGKSGDTEVTKASDKPEKK